MAHVYVHSNTTALRVFSCLCCYQLRSLQYDAECSSLRRLPCRASCTALPDDIAQVKCLIHLALQTWRTVAAHEHGGLLDLAPAPKGVSFGSSFYGPLLPSLVHHLLDHTIQL